MKLTKVLHILQSNFPPTITSCPIMGRIILAIYYVEIIFAGLVVSSEMKTKI